MIKGFKIFPFMDKNDPNEDVDIPNVDSRDLFTSGGKNPLDRGNHIMDFFIANDTIFFSYKDILDLNKGKYNPFASRTAPNTGLRIPITSSAALYTDKFIPFSDGMDAYGG
jgi:hypothetical protein